MELSSGTIINALGAKAEVYSQAAADKQIVSSLSWDSRTVKPGGVFVAIKGEHSDGNHFLMDALTTGAVLLVASSEPSLELLTEAHAKGAALIEVKDPEWAVGEIAKLWRTELAARVIGVTGSSGKTSTKELVASVLSQAYLTEKNPGNFNNLLGLPFTILSTSANTELLVLEMGMQHKGEIARYSEISNPEMAVFTNIGQAHKELLGSQEAIAEAKAELLEALPDGYGVAILNADDPYTAYLIQLGRLRERGVTTISYGLSDQAEVTAKDISYDSQGLPLFTLVLASGQSTTVKLSMPGEHSVVNALAAAALGELLGISIEQIATGLSEAQTVALRAEMVQIDEVLIINDSYNANPDSMAASLKTLALMDNVRPHIAVLGDMFELGSDEEALHRQVGKLAASSGLSQLITVGTRARFISEAAVSSATRSEGNALQVTHVSEWQEVIPMLQAELHKAPIILVKASRGMALERIVESLTSS